MRKVCAGFGAELRTFNGQADHVHLLVGHPELALLSRKDENLPPAATRFRDVLSAL